MPLDYMQSPWVANSVVKAWGGRGVEKRGKRGVKWGTSIIVATIRIYIKNIADNALVKKIFIDP